MIQKRIDPIKTCIPAWILIISAAVLLIIASFVPPAAGAEYVVAPSGGSFTSIQNAVTWASPLDTIVVKSGTYPGTVKIDKRITLIGMDTGGGAPVIDPGRKGTAVEIDADNCSVQGFVIRNSAEASGILVASNGNTISNNTLTGNAVGIQLSSTNSNWVTGNTITANSRAGIVLKDAQGNLIYGNRLTNNAIGISIDELSGANTIYLNSFSNTVNVVSRGSGQQWESPSSLTYTYMGRSFTRQLGNYWSDYRGTGDQNSDGVGDASYIIRSESARISGNAGSGNEIDPAPLMDPIDYYLQISSAASGTGTITPPSSPSVTAPATGQVSIPEESTSLPGSHPGRDLVTLVIIIILIGIVGVGGMLFIRSRSQHKGQVLSAPVNIDDTPSRQVHASHHVDESLVYSKPPLDTGPMETVPALETEVITASRESALPSAGSKFYFPPELESRYSDIRHIGRGGVAQVFAAHRKSDNLLVAVKIPISFDEVTGKCFLNEIAAWQTLRHKNIVEVLEVNILPVPYVEMEYVPGSLESVEKPLPVWKAVHLVHGIADGLAYAHTHGIIHRDIKPHNILVTSDFVPKITDWGMSKVIATTMDKSNVAGFSLSYAAPEQVSPAEFGRTDIRTDIYQLGALFYELVTGSIPFGGDSIVEVGNAIVRDDPLPPTEYNPDAEVVEKIILKCLAKNPADRYQSADELLNALSRYLDEDDE
ncbi:protein kinase [Methanoregula boonei 6A8]|uniref:Protein kinase n=1 Tax=Methanoregula boonei (strain DSM 21154 / JCM 14090 / 6A8) TaxID=456442 RepID=A7I9S3_METB6|nr:NosD domain-containing protein [Methanoregula boonei]ABS56484.1 protein kinase [Methanoregula boonei 6A8]